MRPNRFLLLIALFSVAVLLNACSKSGEAEHAAEKEQGPSRVRRGSDGSTIVSLDEATQKLIALAVEPVEATQLDDETTRYGRVIDPAPLASLVNDLASAQAAFAASEPEFTRQKSLSAQNNASIRTLQAAEAAARRDELALRTARDKLELAWGKSISERSDLPDFIRSLMSRDSALVRIDLPPGEALTSPPVYARIIPLADEQASLEAAWFGELPAIDPATQSRGLLFLIQPNRIPLAPGAAVTGYLAIGGERKSGVVVPRAAVIRHEGAAWVYLRSEGTNFTRRAVTLEQPMENGWFVSSGVKAGDEIVTTGVQTVFSTELNASGFLSGERE